MNRRDTLRLENEKRNPTPQIEIKELKQEEPKIETTPIPEPVKEIKTFETIRKERKVKSIHEESNLDETTT